MKISAVVNTYNEAKTVERCLRSLAWADEIVVVDNLSEDNTAQMAKQFTDHVFIYEKHHGFVEPLRNFAIDKATGDWILIVDADEEIPESLAKKLQSIAAGQSDANWYELPRKNIIFGQWFEGSGWWPDYNIRFFKKGSVVWSDLIHRPPKTSGTGEKLSAEESFAVIHYHYQTISQFMLRMDRYTTIQTRELVDNGYQFHWIDLLSKPLSEFLTRFYDWQGYKFGIHGLALSLLQAISFFVVYLKVWEHEKFATIPNDQFLSEFNDQTRKMGQELSFWQSKITGKKTMKSKLKSLLSK